MAQVLLLISVHEILLDNTTVYSLRLWAKSNHFVSDDICMLIFYILKKLKFPHIIPFIYKNVLKDPNEVINMVININFEFGRPHFLNLRWNKNVSSPCMSQILLLFYYHIIKSKDLLLFHKNINSVKMTDSIKLHKHDHYHQHAKLQLYRYCGRSGKKIKLSLR